MNAPTTAVKALVKTPFRNLDSQTVPPFAVMQVTGTVVEDGVTFLACTQVGSSLATEFAVNGPTRVSPGASGICYREGDVRIAFDTGSPAPGESWGVRANQWTLSRGYPPIVTVTGVASAAAFILTGRLKPLESVVGAPLSSLAPQVAGQPGTGLVAVYAWNGAMFAPAEPAMQITGDNLASTAMRVGTIAPFVRSSGRWTAGSDAGDKTAVVSVYGPTANENCLWPGKIANPATATSYCTDRFPDGSNCWLVLLASESGSTATNTASLDVGQHYIGRHVGEFDNGGGSTTPIYAIRPETALARFISFRLHHQLKTSDSEQTNAALVAYWDGGNPDWAEEGVLVQNLPTDYEGIYKFSGDANAVGYATWNPKLGTYEICALEGDGRRWVLWKNTSEAACPALGCFYDTGVTLDDNGHDNERSIIQGEQPGTTLRRGFWINGYADVEPDAIGVCSSSENPVEALLSTGAVFNGQSVGPKPGQWTLEPEYPGATVVGVASGAVGLIRQEPLLSLLAKTISAVAAGVPSQDYQIQAGAIASESDAGWLTVPNGVSRTDIDSGKWIRLWWQGNGWGIEPLEC